MSEGFERMPLEVSWLRDAYARGSSKPTDIVAEVYRRIDSHKEEPIWIHLVPQVDALARAMSLEKDPEAHKLPLYGIPFAIKDNMDVAGLPTTAACPAYAYTPGSTAFPVARLLEPGPLLIAKTNIDQLAT